MAPPGARRAGHLMLHELNCSTAGACPSSAAPALRRSWFRRHSLSSISTSTACGHSGRSRIVRMDGRSADRIAGARGRNRIL